MTSPQYGSELAGDLTDPRPEDTTLDTSVDGLRPVRNSDAAGLIALVASAYSEYPGCVLDLPGVDDDLPTPGTTAAERGSPWWVLEHDATIIGSIGAGPLRDDGHVELKRLYLAAPFRGQGLASALVEVVEAYALEQGARGVDLWSDTRFTAAHHRYRALGYVDTGETRELHDPSATTEYRFVKVL